MAMPSKMTRENKCRGGHYLIDGMMSTIDGGASVGRFCGRPGGCRPPTDEEERVRSH